MIVVFPFENAFDPVRLVVVEEMFESFFSFINSGSCKDDSVDLLSERVGFADEPFEEEDSSGLLSEDTVAFDLTGEVLAGGWTSAKDNCRAIDSPKYDFFVVSEGLFEYFVLEY